MFPCQQFIFILTIIISSDLISKVGSTCDRTFFQSELEKINLQYGTFESPSRVAKRPFNITKLANSTILSISQFSKNSTTNLDHKPMHCIYKFVANEGERVALNFSSFNLRGDEPECLHEYVDIFIKFKSVDLELESQFGNETANGRFCTTVRPRRIISLYNTLVLVIHSDLKPASNKKRPLFGGTYEFIKGKPFDQIGYPEGDSLCNHTIYSNSKREGEFQSVTYPGVYIKGLKCSYKFIGEPGQRVRLEFLDLDIYSGGSHCPFDSLKVFDGLDDTEPLINTFCGSHRSLIIFSSGKNLLVTFTTLEWKAEIQNRGFSAYFEFSDKFVDATFIQGPNVKYIRGSECDQRVISNRGTKGIITSPTSRHHTNAICRYVFEGLQTSNDYEKVQLKFIEFDFKTPRTLLPLTSATTTTTTTTTTPSPQTGSVSVPEPYALNQTSSSTSSPGSVEQCPDNYLRIYTGEQKPDQKQDSNDYDYVYCGAETASPPQGLESDAASLLMEYNSGSIGGFFKAEYSFIVDYRIPGTQTSTGCDYIYKSDSLKSGSFNSPRHPSWYLNDINCTYNFVTKTDETLLLQFVNFKMYNSFNEKVLGIEEACKREDQVEIYELTYDNQEISNNNDSLGNIVSEYRIGTFCGTTTPGPILSYKPVRIRFTTNNNHVFYGFSALYYFYPINMLKTNEFVTQCGGQIVASQRLKSGNISSPETYRPETYEKRNHICSWTINARLNHRISLKFDSFELEGSRIVRGCMAASVRLTLGTLNKIPIELCGTLTNSSEMQYVSDNEWLMVTFISTKQASGSNGFTATWTEIKRSIS